MYTISLFNICQGLPKSLRDYLSHFNEATIRAVPPNQEKFAGVFQNGLQEGHFNKSIVQKPTFPLVEVVAKVKCCIKDEESNAKNKACKVKERASDAENSHHLRTSNYNLPIKDKSTFKRNVRK